MQKQESSSAKNEKISTLPQKNNPLKKVETSVPVTVLKYNNDQSQKETRNK